MNNTRHERFKRLAQQRTNSVLDKLRLIGNLSNRANYEYSEEEIQKVFRAIDKQVKVVKLKFLPSKNKKEFKL